MALLAAGSDGFQAETVCERVVCCGALVGVGSSKWGQESLSLRMPLILKVNTI